MSFAKMTAFAALLLTAGAFAADAETVSTAVRACCDVVAACCGQGMPCCP